MRPTCSTKQTTFAVRSHGFVDRQEKAARTTKMLAGKKRFRSEKRRSDPRQLWIDRHGYSADDVYARFTVCACGRAINFVDRHAHMSKYCVIALWCRQETATTFGRFGTTRKAFLFLEKPNERTATHVHQHTNVYLGHVVKHAALYFRGSPESMGETNENEKTNFFRNRKVSGKQKCRVSQT